MSTGRIETAAGVVLVGGRSSRMGRPKAALEWHGSTLLYRTAAILARTVAGPVVVVRAPGQPLPALPPGVEVTEDPVEGIGPMQGIAAGLVAVEDRSDAAFVASCDLPLLHPAYVRAVLGQLVHTHADAVLPTARGYRQPLAAAYRTTLSALLTAMVAAGQHRPGMLLRRCAVVEPTDAELLADPELARLDPGLESVLNVNEPADYAAARRRPPAEITVSATEEYREWTVRAATLAQAGVGGSRLRLNGVRVPSDPALPLVAGDHLTL